MKRYAIAAAALLLGTSALAWAPDKTVEGKPLAAEKSDVKMADAQLKKADMDVVADAKPAWQPVYAEQANAFDDSWAPKVKSASYDAWQDDPAMQDSTPPADEPKWGAEPTVAEAPAPTMLVASADTTPRPATANYPACHPGPGDDNCIQLYERGVRTALASWDRPTGGFAGEQAQAMAANSSPADDATEIASADTDEGVMPAPGTEMAAATPGDEVLAAGIPDTGTEMAANDPAFDSNSPYQGVGGPDEALMGDEAASATMQTGYPACSRTVTDRCIQLYERGVTGEGN